MRVLIVEDDEDLAASIAKALEHAGYAPETASTGPEAIERAAAEPFGAVILDVGLPGMNGFEVLRHLRKNHPKLSILMATGETSPESIVKGLDSGADDYIRKPYAVRELVARLRTITRPSEQPFSGRLTAGDLTLDLTTHQAFRGEKTILLTIKEQMLLHCLMSHPGKVFSREEISAQVWGHDFESGTNVIDLYIHYLRTKIDQGFPEPRIHTIPKAGYQFK